MRKAGVWAAAVMLGLGLGLQQGPAQAAGLDQFTIVQTCAGQQFFGAAQKGSQGFGTVDYFGTLCTSGAGGGGGGGGAVYGPTAQGAAPTGTGAQPVLVGILDRNGAVRVPSSTSPLFTTDANVAQAFAAPGTATPNGALSVQRPDGTPVAGDGTDATGVTAPSGATGIRGWLSGIYSTLTQATNNTGATSTKAQAVQRPDGTALAGDGTDNTGVSQPSGGSGIRGWLSAIYSKLSTFIVARTDQTTHGTTDKVAADLYVSGSPVNSANPAAFIPGGIALGASLTPSGALGVVQQDGLTVAVAASATGPLTSGAYTTGAIPTTGWQSTDVQVTSAGTGNTWVYEVSNDGTTWYGASGYQTSNLGNTAPAGTSSGLELRTFPLNAAFFRIRVTTYGSGTVGATLTFKANPVAPIATYVTPQDGVADVVSASAVGPFTGGTADPTTGSEIMTGFQSFSAQFSAVGTSPVVVFEGSNLCTSTATDWQTLEWKQIAGTGTYTGNTSVVVGGYYQFNVNYKCARIRLISGSGTTTATIIRKITPVFPVNLLATVAQGTGSSVAGWGTVGATTSAGGGVQSYCRLPSAAATTNAANCKASQGRVYKIIACNTTTTPARIKFYNTTATPTPGTTPVAFTRPIPAAAAAGGLACVSYDMSDIGWWLSTGISYAITLGAADSDTAPLASAGAITDVSIEYQ